MIAERTAQETHTFIYLGADHDAWSASGGIGIAAANTVSYDKHTTRAAFASLSRVSKRYVADFEEETLNAQGLAKGGSKEAMFEGYTKPGGAIADDVEEPDAP